MAARARTELKGDGSSFAVTLSSSPLIWVPDYAAVSKANMTVLKGRPFILMGSVKRNQTKLDESGDPQAILLNLRHDNFHRPSVCGLTCLRTTTTTDRLVLYALIFLFSFIFLH